MINYFFVIVSIVIQVVLLCVEYGQKKLLIGINALFKKVKNFFSLLDTVLPVLITARDKSKTIWLNS